MLSDRASLSLCLRWNCVWMDSCWLMTQVSSSILFHWKWSWMFWRTIRAHSRSKRRSIRWARPYHVAFFPDCELGMFFQTKPEPSQRIISVLLSFALAKPPTTWILRWVHRSLPLGLYSSTWFWITLHFPLQIPLFMIPMRFWIVSRWDKVGPFRDVSHPSWRSILHSQNLSPNCEFVHLMKSWECRKCHYFHLRAAKQILKCFALLRMSEFRLDEMEYVLGNPRRSGSIRLSFLFSFCTFNKHWSWWSATIIWDLGVVSIHYRKEANHHCCSLKRKNHPALQGKWHAFRFSTGSRFCITPAHCKPRSSTIAHQPVSRWLQ